MSDHIKVLLEGQEFSDEFKSKATTIFETAVETEVAKQVGVLKEELETENETLVEEKIKSLESITEQYIEDELIPNISKYLTYGITEWLEENKQILANNSKVKLAESMIAGLTDILESQGLVVPESQQTVVESLETELAESKAKANSLLRENIDLKDQMNSINGQAIVDEFTKDLSESQAETFKEVTSKVKFIDESQYREAIKDLYESYYPSKTITEPEAPKVEQEPVTENKDWSKDTFYSNLSKLL